MQWLETLLKFVGIGRRDPANVISDGWERLSDRLEKRIVSLEGRVDECEEDRNLQREQMAQMRIRMTECDEDRDKMLVRLTALELHEAMNLPTKAIKNNQPES